MFSSEALKTMSKTQLEACLARFQMPIKKRQGKKRLAERILDTQNFVEQCRQHDEEDVL